MISYPQTFEAIEMFLGSCVSVDEELNSALEITYGAIPKSLSGTLFRNGPGRFAVGPDAYSHLFDGDGLISSFRFSEGNVTYRNSYVKTSEYRRENSARRMLYRGFGSNIPGGLRKNAFRMHFKNAANTNIVAHAGHLYACWEGGWPHRIDATTLETIDRYHFNDQLKNQGSVLDRWMNPQLPFSAHPKIDPTSGRMYNFGLAFGVENRLMIYEVCPLGQMSQPRYLKLDQLSFIHDFVITSDSKAIFFATPVHFDLFAMLSGLSTPAEAMAGDASAPIQILVVDLKGPAGEISWSTVEVFEAPHAFMFHHVNAFEEHGEIHVYSAEMDSFPNAQSAKAALRGDGINYPLTRLAHYVLTPGQKQATKKILPVRGFEMPRVADSRVGLPFTEFFTTGVSRESHFPLMDQIQKISTDGQNLGSFTYTDGLVGEAVVASFASDARTSPESGPESGSNSSPESSLSAMLLSVCYNHKKRKSELVILNADTMELVARALLPHSQPLGFHGNWVPRVPQVASTDTSRARFS